MKVIFEARDGEQFTDAEKCYQYELSLDKKRENVLPLMFDKDGVSNISNCTFVIARSVEELTNFIEKVEVKVVHNYVHLEDYKHMYAYFYFDEVDGVFREIDESNVETFIANAERIHSVMHKPC